MNRLVELGGDLVLNSGDHHHEDQKHDRHGQVQPRLQGGHVAQVGAVNLRALGVQAHNLGAGADRRPSQHARHRLPGQRVNFLLVAVGLGLVVSDRLGVEEPAHEKSNAQQLQRLEVPGRNKARV